MQFAPAFCKFSRPGKMLLPTLFSFFSDEIYTSLVSPKSSQINRHFVLAICLRSMPQKNRFLTRYCLRRRHVTTYFMVIEMASLHANLAIISHLSARFSKFLGASPVDAPPTELSWIERRLMPPWNCAIAVLSVSGIVTQRNKQELDALRWSNRNHRIALHNMRLPHRHINSS